MTVPLVTAWALDKTFDYEIPSKLIDRVAAGTLVRCRLGNRRIRGIVVRVSETIPSRELAPLDGVVLDTPVAAPPMTELLEWVARRYASVRGAAYKLAAPARVRVAPATSRPPRPEPSGVIESLSEGRALAAAIGTRAGGAWCVRVPYGRYLDAVMDVIGAALAQDTGAVLIAAPEVGPTADLVTRLAGITPGVVRVDSAAAPAERSEGLVSLASGRAVVGVGGRAAVLASVPRLGAVVVLDEHHPAYKEERAPRYDARMVALERSRLQGAICVLIGTAPLMETAHAVATGAISVAEGTRSHARAQRPAVELVPMPSGHPLSPPLLNRVRREIEAGGRVALVANERGYAPVLWCASCRHSLRCPECDSALAFDRDRVRVRCPRCGYTTAPPDQCPTCGASDFRYLGAGTERLEEQLAQTFPRARIARLDADSPSPEPGADVYVSTWHGTKEAIRPDASFVAVLNADALIRRSDFRSAERAHHAFTRMAEWAGPASEGGRLMLQTLDPGHHAIQAVTRADYWHFATRELDIRRELRYPPFVDLIRLNATGANARPTLERAVEAARRHGDTVLGPVTTRTKAGTTLEMLLKCADAMVVADDLRDILATVPSGTRLRVDVDPR